jgi:xanthine dehydrogenase accessory factor
MNIFKEAARLQEDNIPFAIATIVKTSGSTPRQQAKMIIKKDGSTIGTIGGGQVEALVIKDAITCIEEGKSKLGEYGLCKTKNIEMNCGGILSVFIEVLHTRPRLLILGGGHCGLKIAQLADFLNYEYSLLETRKEFATRERFPNAKQIYFDEDQSKAVDLVPHDKDMAVIIVTHKDDYPSLKKLFLRDVKYIGKMGSMNTISKMMKWMRENGVGEDVLSKIHAPIGLDIGNETPEEIAVSILGEVMMALTGTTAQPMKRKYQNIVVVRGGGDLATGTIVKLYKSGFKVVVLECEKPTVIRRTVALGQAVYEGESTVEGVTAVLAKSVGDVYKILDSGNVPVLVDPEAKSIQRICPTVLVDAIIAKKNLGTRKGMAPLVIALGPGFEAPNEVDVVIETNRGHNLGRLIYNGTAEPDTKQPGSIDGYTFERLLCAPCEGTFRSKKKIGDLVQAGEVVAFVNEMEIKAKINGMVRGLISDGIHVTKGLKVGDIDPRGEKVDYRSISDKARAIAGGVLEAILHFVSKERISMRS